MGRVLKPCWSAPCLFSFSFQQLVYNKSTSVAMSLTENVKMTPIFMCGITVTTQTGTIHRLRHVDFLIPDSSHCNIALIVSR